MKRMFAKPAVLIVFVTTILLMCPGCAKGPAGGSTSSGGQLIVTMTVAGKIRPDYFYFVLFNTTNNPTASQGPIPVVAAPWGNGFAASQFTQFMRYDASQPSSGYGIYAVVPNSNQQSFTYLGAPVQYTPVQTGGSTLQFQIPISQLATSTIPAASIQSLQINFVTTNRIPVDPNDPGTKLFDALGDARQPGGVNNPITISNLAQAAIYQNSDNHINPEPQGDVTEAGNGVFRTNEDPDLDIVDWRIEVRN